MRDLRTPLTHAGIAAAGRSAGIPIAHGVGVFSETDPAEALDDAVRGDGTAWFAVWTKSRHEAAVRGQIAGRGVDVFLPTIPRWSRWKDRKKRVDWPLFPGYCFARLAPRESLKVTACPGVVGLVSSNGRPMSIPDAEIDAIRTLVSSDVQFDPCPLLGEGARVEVVSGPLRGVTGRLVRKGTRARLLLAVDVIGRGVSVEVDAADVRGI